MKLKIHGRIFATFAEVIEEFWIDVNKDDFSIKQMEDIIVVEVNGETKYFESDSLKIG